MRSTHHPHRIIGPTVIALLVGLLSLGACSDGDDSDTANAAPREDTSTTTKSPSTPADEAPSTPADDAASARAGSDEDCSLVDRDTIAELFGVAPKSVESPPLPGGTTCFFTFDADGIGVYIAHVEEGGERAYAEAANAPAMPGDPKPVPVDVGDKAVASVALGVAELYALSGDSYIAITAGVPNGSPLSDSPDDLLAATTDLAETVL